MKGASEESTKKVCRNPGRNPSDNTEVIAEKKKTQEESERILRGSKEKSRNEFQEESMNGTQQDFQINLKEFQKNSVKKSGEIAKGYPK